MKKNKIAYALLVSAVLFPTISFAAFNGIRTYLTDIHGLLGEVEAIVVGLAFVFFFWGIAQFILNAADSKARADGRQKMIWGVIALFVLFSVYGLIRFIAANLGIDTTANGGTGGNNTALPSALQQWIDQGCTQESFDSGVCVPA